MRGRAFISVLAAASLCADSGPILGVANAPKPFSIGTVHTKPEAGPVSQVEGDEVAPGHSTVTFRLNGDDRAILAGNSKAKIRGYKDGGSYFYLSKGSIQFDARKLPLAICARDRLYVPSIPASGEVAIRDNKVQVRMTAGSMIRSGVEACDAKAVPLLVTGAGTGAAAAGGVAATAGAAASAGAAATAGAAVTATATAAGIGAATATVGAVAVAAGAVAGVTAAVVAAEGPASESPITPGQ